MKRGTLLSKMKYLIPFYGWVETVQFARAVDRYTSADYGTVEKYEARHHCDQLRETISPLLSALNAGVSAVVVALAIVEVF